MIKIIVFFILTGIASTSLAWGYSVTECATLKCEFKLENMSVNSELITRNNQEYVLLRIAHSNKMHDLYFRITSRDRAHTEGSYQDRIEAVRVYLSNEERFTSATVPISKATYLTGFFPFSSLHGKAGSIAFLAQKYSGPIYQNEFINCSQSFK